MANIGIFDVLGPIMIGPSSSHTAGAARLGKIAGTIVNKPIKEVSFLLHGSFRETYKGQVHPNTVKFLIKDIDDIEWEVLGSSIGGGLVEIHEINGKKVKITGEYPTIITCHDDVPGTVSKISTLFYENKINIAFMSLSRNQKGKDATMTLEVDTNISDEIINEIKSINGVNRVIVINSLGGF